MMWRLHQSNWKKYPSPGYRVLLLEEIHTTYLHIGAPKMYHLLRSTFWWPNMERDCTIYTSHCLACQLEKGASNAVWAGTMITPPVGPRLEWSVDLMTELPAAVALTTHRPPLGAKVHIIVAVDTFSKFVLLGTLATRSSNAVTDWLRTHLLAVFGKPQRFRTDNGGEFAGTLALVCDALDIKFGRTSSFHSSANG
jgi:Integrase zinc binding domain/Integrase core domain